METEGTRRAHHSVSAPELHSSTSGALQPTSCSVFSTRCIDVKAVNSGARNGSTESVSPQPAESKAASTAAAAAAAAAGGVFNSRSLIGNDGRLNEDEEAFLTRFDVGDSSPTRLRRDAQAPAGERSFQLVCASVFAVSCCVVLAPLLVRKASKLRGITTATSFDDDDAETEPVLYLAEGNARDEGQGIRVKPVGSYEASESTLPGPRRARHRADNVSDTAVLRTNSGRRSDRRAVTRYAATNESPSISSINNTADAPLAKASGTSTPVRSANSGKGNVAHPGRRGKERKNPTEQMTPNIVSASFAASERPVIRGRSFTVDSRLGNNTRRAVAILKIPRASDISLAERRFQFFFVTSPQHSTITTCSGTERG
ncbi:hypothetical protein MTO96_020698 [Rhipicephalus appendiculatus]